MGFLNQPGEPRGENVARYAQAPVELIEPLHAEKRVPQDQQRPAFADDLEGLGEGAVHGCKRSQLHESAF
jgi:hypothetical protein